MQRSTHVDGRFQALQRERSVVHVRVEIDRREPRRGAGAHGTEGSQVALRVGLQRRGPLALGGRGGLLRGRRREDDIVQAPGWYVH